MPALFALLAWTAGAALPTAGPFKPFDLTYLPRTDGSLVAVRPGELLKQIGNPDEAAAEGVQRVLAAAFAFFGGDLKAARPPALADIDQVVVSARFKLGFETGADGRGTMGVDQVSSGLVRTAEPFDWAGCVGKWFPKAESVKHAGREYVRVPIALGKEKSFLALYAADDRTLAFDTDEDAIKKLLDRLDKKAKPPAPAGWGEVNRDLVAVWHDTSAEGWLTAPERPKREIDRAFLKALRGMSALAVGFSAGERTALRIVTTSDNERAAAAVQTALKAVAELEAKDANTEPAAAKLFAALTVNREGKVVRVAGSTEGNVFRRLLEPGSDR